MIIILKRNANPEKVEILKQELEHKGFKLHLSQGTQTSLIGLIGDTTSIHEDWLKAMDVVEDVRRIREPYKKASRSMHPENTVVDVCGQKIGGGHFQVIAGSMLHRDQRADHPGGRGCKALRSPSFTGRGLQAQDLPLCFPGTP